MIKRRVANLIIILSMLVIGLDASAQDVSSSGEIKPLGKIELVHDGFQFTEGPAWDPRGTLYFTDVRTSTIHKIHDGKLAAFTTESQTANGLVVAKDGRLLACQMEGQVVAYDLETGVVSLLAGEYQGKRFNAPNDLVIDKQGGIYFTDPHFRAPDPWPQSILAVYYIAHDGTVSRVTDHIEAPNGVALSPDEQRLYVIPSGQAEMLVYDVDAPGKLSNKRILCRLRQPDDVQHSGGDGMAVDMDGNLYITSNLGVQIFSPTGEPRGLIEFPQQPANVTFGGPDRKTLFATARTGLYKVQMPIAGLPSN
jgi:gluconolactonase